MQQGNYQQQQPRRNNNNNNYTGGRHRNGGKLAAAFALRSRENSVQDQSGFVAKGDASSCLPAADAHHQQANQNPTQQEAPQQQQQQQQQPQQQPQSDKDFVSVCKKHEAIEFLEKHNIPTFVPVYEDVCSIQLNPAQPNHALKGQVPWKCAHCGANSFGHHCMGCTRHRDEAALRVFVGQLCKEGSGDIVKKMLEVLVEPHVAGPIVFVEPHTDASTGRGKGCAWVYVSSLQDIPVVVKCLNKRTFVTVDEITGNVGFVAFPSSFSNSEIEHCFQEDHHAQGKELQALFMFTCISAQVPKALQGLAPCPHHPNHNHNNNHNNNNVNNNNNNKKSAVKNHNNTQNGFQQQNHQGVASGAMPPPPPPPSYGSSLPPPPCFLPQQQQQIMHNNNNNTINNVVQTVNYGTNMMMMMMPSAPVANVYQQQHTNFVMDNRRVEELQQQQQQQVAATASSIPVPIAYLGEHYNNNHNNYQQQTFYQQQQQRQVVPNVAPTTQTYTASWVANCNSSNGSGSNDDDNFF